MTAHPVYKIICSGCGRHFEWVPREQANEVPPSYHSKHCRRRFRDDPKSAGRCPRPYKRVYVTYELAQAECTRLGDPMLKPYRCRCGALHIGHPIAWIDRYEDPTVTKLIKEES